MKRWLLAAVLLLLVSQTATAEQILLKSGQSLSVNVLERHPDYIKVDAGIGVPVIYYYNEIERIDGRAVGDAYHQEVNGANYASSSKTYGMAEKKTSADVLSLDFSDMFSGGAFGMGAFVLMCIIYILFCIPMYMIAEKLDVKFAWLSFVPLVQIYIMFKCGGFSGWGILLLAILVFIPFLGVLVNMYVWFKIAENCDKPAWTGFLICIPLVNIGLPWYLALSNSRRMGV